MLPPSRKELDLDSRILQDFHGHEVIFDDKFTGQIPSLDNKAVIKISSILDDTSALRISVIGGGCSGFTYSYDIIKKINSDDLYISKNPLVVIDPISIKYMPGAIIKWVDNVIFSNFEVDNPGAQQGCGCGSSFSFDMFKEWGI